MTTGYVYDPAHRQHTHPRAPESAARLIGLIDALADMGELDPLCKLDVERIPWEWVAAAHTKSHVDAVRRLASEGKKRISFDTYLSPAAPEVALLGASSAVSAARAVSRCRITCCLRCPMWSRC